MSTHLLRGSRDEIRKMQEVEERTGIDLDAFMFEMATTDPIGNHGRCIFCDGGPSTHLPLCKWVELRAALGIDGGAA